MMNNNTLLDASYIIAVIIEIGLPIILAIYVHRKYRVSYAIFFLGIAFFLISLVRIPLNSIFSSFIYKYLIGDLAYMLSVLFASFTAGLFEEGVRVLALGIIIKKRSFEKAIMYGIGHGGGGESMILVGFSVLISFIAFKFFPEIIPSNITGQISGISWYVPLVGAVERIFAMVIQVSLSILIISAFTRKRYYFILIAVLYHTVIDFVAAYINYRFNNILFTEIIVFIFAAISAVIIYIMRSSGIVATRVVRS